MAGTRSALRVALLVAALAAALVLAWLGWEPAPVGIEGPPAPPHASGDPVLSLLAVGDTGELLPFRPFGEGQRSVARGMVAEDRRSPVDALVLLGDNFYPDGLEAHELVERVRANLVRPYCRFADLRGPRSEEVSGACGLDADERNPVPILPVLGNHDYNVPESPELQRRVVSDFLSNWSGPPELADVVELGHGVSLVRADSDGVRLTGSADTIREAVERARGPWVLLALHEPISLREGASAAVDSVKSRVRRALADAGRRVHLVLAGHRHNLQLTLLELPEPALQLVAGSGSSRKPFREPPYRNRVFGIETTGFARIDLVGAGAEQGLRVSVFTMPRYPLVFWPGPRLRSRWWLSRDGEASQLYPPPKSADSRSESDSTS